MKKTVLVLGLLMTSSILFTSCREEQSDVEEATEEVGEGIEDAADDVGDEIEDVGN